jgi:hypothetical protein
MPIALEDEGAERSVASGAMRSLVWLRVAYSLVLTFAGGTAASALVQPATVRADGGERHSYRFGTPIFLGGGLEGSIFGTNFGTGLGLGAITHLPPHTLAAAMPSLIRPMSMSIVSTSRSWPRGGNAFRRVRRGTS